MARFALQYHVHGKNDFNPIDNIDADTIEEATAKAIASVTVKDGFSDGISVSHDNEIIVIPKAQIQYVTVRSVVDRKRSTVRDFDLDATIVEPWNSGQEETAA